MERWCGAKGREWFRHRERRAICILLSDWHALNLAKEQEIQHYCQGGHADSPPDLGREARSMLLCSNLPWSVCSRTLQNEQGYYKLLLGQSLWLLIYRLASASHCPLPVSSVVFCVCSSFKWVCPFMSQGSYDLLSLRTVGLQIKYANFQDDLFKDTTSGLKTPHHQPGTGAHAFSPKLIGRGT